VNLTFNKGNVILDLDHSWADSSRTHRKDDSVTIMFAIKCKISLTASDLHRPRSGSAVDAATVMTTVSAERTDRSVGDVAERTTSHDCAVLPAQTNTDGPVGRDFRRWGWQLAVGPICLVNFNTPTTLFFFTLARFL
jgi:hypothetical protein